MSLFPYFSQAQLTESRKSLHMAPQGRQDTPEHLCDTTGKSSCHYLKPNSECRTIKTAGHCHQSLLPVSVWQKKTQLCLLPHLQKQEKHSKSRNCSSAEPHCRISSSVFCLVHLTYFSSFLLSFPPQPDSK